LFLSFQRILDHLNKSLDEELMIKIQTTTQQTCLHTGRTEIYTTRMLHTRKSGQSWWQLSNWLVSYIRPFQVSFSRIRRNPRRHFQVRERCFEVRERSSTPRSRNWRSTSRIEALEREIEREFEFNLFFSLFLVLCALLLL
jgi:hypothetical protein